MVKVYTRTGDDGTTHCFKSGRISKGDQLIEAIGSVDELNSQIGLLLAHLNADNEGLLPEDIVQIETVQSRLFDVGGALATYSAEKQFAELLPRIDEGPLETAIDKMDAELPEIRQFILPGGTMAASHAHVCRANCRRAERNVVTVYRDLEDPGETVAHGFLRLLKYLNRLSDYLFVLARYLNNKSGNREVFWQSKGAETTD